MDNLDLDIEFFDSAGSNGVVKATVHKTGKLGFNSGATKYMKLDQAEFFNIGFNRADESDESLYLVPVESQSEKTYRLVKAGQYYYLHIKNILRERRIDYKNETVIYDIEEIEQNGRRFYKLARRRK